MRVRDCIGVQLGSPLESSTGHLWRGDKESILSGGWSKHLATPEVVTMVKSGLPSSKEGEMGTNQFETSHGQK